MSSPDGTANLLGAVALALSDRTSAAVAAAGGRIGLSTSSAAALNSLWQFLDGSTLDQLHTVLGVSPSGAVRLVDRLATDDLVTRSPGRDGRTRSVRLTPKGRVAARRVAAARAAVLNDALVDLSVEARQTLHDSLGRIAARIVDTKDGGAWICRLCDLTACGRPEVRCAVANAAAQKYGQRP
jgi:DNA-binding MarR family transcriptional regulator